MRGTKAKRLRKAGLKPGPAPKPELTEKQVKEIENKIKEAKAPYSEQRHVAWRGGFSGRVKEKILKRREESNETE